MTGEPRTESGRHETPKLSYRDALETLRERQKPGPGVPAYTRWVNRRLAQYIAVFAYRHGIGPNAVTMISALVSAAGLCVLVLAPRTIAVGFGVAVLLAAGYLLDSADGQVARLSRRSSPAGEWLDHVIDAVRMPLMHLCTLVALFQDGAPTWTLAIPFTFALVTTGQFFSQILAEQLLGSGSKPAPRRYQSLLLLPTDTGTLCWMYLLWGIGGGFVWAYLLLLVLNTVHSALSMRRRFRQLDALSTKEAK